MTSSVRSCFMASVLLLVHLSLFYCVIIYGAAAVGAAVVGAGLPDGCWAAAQ
jgi:hypothetical protein